MQDQNLSMLEVNILSLLLEDKSDNEIAAELQIAERAVVKRKIKILSILTGENTLEG